MLKVQTLISQKELVDFIESSSNEFKPPISRMVESIDDYCKKLLEKAALFIARENHIVVGVIAFYCNDEIQKQAYLPYFYIKPDNRSQGIGQMLLRKAILHSQTCGMKSMKFETWADNRSISLYREHGFRQEGTRNTQGVSRVVMVVRFEGVSEYQRKCMCFTPLEEKEHLSNHLGIELYIKRDDYFPMSGGGNKARKIWYIIDYAIKNGYDTLVTNGGIQSNHARAAALAAAEKGLECKLVLHGDTGKAHKLEGNLLLMYLADADIEVVPLSQLSEAMDSSMEELRAKGLNPLYVWGGGHCVQGALAYYEAVKEFNKQAGNWEPDYVLFASGTGTTQAGLAVGFADRNIKVIGVSVAREKERGEAFVRSAVDELACGC